MLCYNVIIHSYVGFELMFFFSSQVVVVALVIIAVGDMEVMILDVMETSVAVVCGPVPLLLSSACVLNILRLFQYTLGDADSSVSGGRGGGYGGGDGYNNGYGGDGKLPLGSYPIWC